MATVAIAGAAGFVGRALAATLSTRHEVLGLSRSPQAPGTAGIETWRQCDLFSLLDAEAALEGVDVAYYLVHSMLPSARLTQGKFEDFDLIAADNFARAAKSRGVKHVIYLGGLVPDHRPLSRHLASRLEVEHALRHQGPKLTALRAGLIIGAQGSSFQMLLRLVRRLPVMLCPKWTASRTQPISLEDTVRLLELCLDAEPVQGKTYDIGGPDVLTYRQMMERAAKVVGRSPWMVGVPLFSPGLSRLWVTLITGAPKPLVGPLVQSLRHDMVARNLALQEWAALPGMGFEQAIKAALAPAAPTRHARPRAYRRPDAQDPDVRSVQRLPRPQGHDALWAAEQYMKWLPRVLPWLLRVRVDQGHCWIGLRGLRTALLQLDYAPQRSSSDRALFYIRGGLLVRHPGRGRLEFRLSPNGCSLLCALHEYRPALPWYLYKASQAVAHVWVMKAFARHLAKGPA